MRKDWETMLENSVFKQDYDKVKALYEKEFGKRQFIGKLAETIQPRQAGVKAKEDKPYQAVRRSLERFEKGKFHSMSKYGPQVVNAMQNLQGTGKISKDDSITITIKGDQKMGAKHGGTRPREFTATFHGDAARQFRESPTMEQFWEEAGYPDDVVDRFEDGDYELDIGSIS